jgi:hypothetical protein
VLLMAGSLPESWIPPDHILDLRARVRRPDARVRRSARRDRPKSRARVPLGKSRRPRRPNRGREDDCSGRGAAVDTSAPARPPLCQRERQSLIRCPLAWSAEIKQPPALLLSWRSGRLGSGRLRPGASGCLAAASGQSRSGSTAAVCSRPTATSALACRAGCWRPAHRRSRKRTAVWAATAARPGDAASRRRELRRCPQLVGWSGDRARCVDLSTVQ